MYITQRGDVVSPVLMEESKKRGINVISFSEIMAATGRLKDGEILTTSMQRPLFTLTPYERFEIFRQSAYIQGVITGRAKRISALNWEIKKKTNEIDRIVENLKMLKQIFDENKDPGDMRQIITRRKSFINIRAELKDVFPDLSNFDRSLRRYVKKTNAESNNKAEEIRNWLNNPNPLETFDQFIEKWVIDLMVHGTMGMYKESFDQVLDNMYILPGGSVIPLRTTFVSGVNGFVQMLPGFEPKLYFSDEISFDTYIPNSMSSYGLIPLEALINKIVESLLFDQLAAERADGTKPPDKAVVFGDTRSPFGDFTEGEFDLPMDIDKQRRVEQKLNTIKKNAIITLTGVGSPMILDLSKAETFSTQNQRQDKILKDIGLVYNMSPMELGLTGSEDTSGRSTSEAQAKIEKEKGIFPIILSIESIINREILPFRFGSDYYFEYDRGLTEQEQIEIDTAKKNSGTYDVNEIRIARGDEPYPEEKFDRPEDVQAPDGGVNNPLFKRQV